jgi:cellulose synthase/poly-beta-1,6-N-acetylglucosamine synthase-like glycosyltransferase
VESIIESKNMKVSVVIPVRRDRNIDACLAGLFAMVGESPDEVIVVENDSDQTLRGVICSYPVHYECEPVPGVYRARNRGIRAARGEIIAFLDADCVPSRYWLSELTRGFHSEAVGGVAGCIRKKAVDRGVLAKGQRAFLLRDGLQYLSPIFPAPYAPGGNVAFRKRVLETLDHFDTDFSSGGDVDLSWRLQLAGYSLEYRGEAEVTATPLSTVVDYFKRYYKYGLGQVMLYRKFRTLTGKRILFNSYPFIGMTRAFCQLLTRGVYQIVVYGDPACAAGRAMDMVEHLALLSGAVVGSLRYKVIYI